MKQKLLIFSDWFSPAYKVGGPVQSIAQLCFLLRDTFEIYVVTSTRDLNEELRLPENAKNKFVDGQGIRIIYLDNEHLTLRSIRSIVKEVNPSVFFFNGLFNTYFAKIVLLLLVTARRKKRVLSVRGMLKESAFSRKKSKKRIYIYLLKLLGGHKQFVFHCTTESEQAEVIREFGKKTKTQVLSNVPFINKERKNNEKNNILRLVYAARVHPIKNLLQVVGALQKVKEPIELCIIGVIEGERYWEKCKDRIEKLPQNIKVRYLGSIEHALLMKELTHHHVYILPTLGENFGHSIFEAFTNGLPVIISDQTPWRELEEKKIGFDIPLNQPQKFVEAIEFFARMQDSEYHKWSQNANEFALDYFSKQNYLAGYQSLFTVNKKVGIVAPMPFTRYKGGISVFVENILAKKSEFKSEGIDLHFINTCIIPRSNNSAGKLKFVNLKNYIKFLRSAYRKIKEDDIPIVHIHTSTGLALIKDAFSGWIFKTVLGTKIILHPNYVEANLTSKKWTLKIATFLINRTIDKVIILSENLKEKLISLGIPSHKIEVVMNFYAKGSKLQEIVKPKESTTLLFIGTLDERKGILDLLKSLRSLIHLNWTMDVAGEFMEEEFKDIFLSTLIEFNLSDRIRLKGYVSGKDKWQLFESSDILILPSYAEGFPLAILEALSYGNAIITTNVGANNEQLGEICNLIEPGNITQLTREIKLLLTNKELLDYRKLQSGNLSEKYTFEVFKKQIIKIYDKI